jgi:hypothetical protein
MNEIMKQCSTKGFVKTIEELLTKMFNCERVNVVLVHRWKRYLFRIVSVKGVDSYDIHDIGKGISGVVALSSSPIWTDKI